MIEAIKQLPRGVCNFLLILTGVILWEVITLYLDNTQAEYRRIGTQINSTMSQIESVNTTTAQSLSAIHKDITALQIDLTKLRASVLTPEQVKLMIQVEMSKYHNLKKD